MDIDFMGFAGDCVVRGRLHLGQERLTDLLNGQTSYRVQDVTLESLEDGHLVQAPEVTLDREELFAALATGPRGVEARRIYTIRQRLILQLGPYTVAGNLHTMPGATAMRSVRLRRAMVPLTEAVVSYVCAGRTVSQEAGTVIVNGELADSMHQEEIEELVPALRSVEHVEH